MLSHILLYREDEIGEMCNEKDVDLPVRFENRLLDQKSEFNTELEIHIVDINCRRITHLYNDLLFAFKISEYLNEEVLINDASDDPYQWLLIQNQKLSLAEAVDNEYNGVTILRSKIQELSIEKSLEMLPSISYIQKSDSVYFVSPSSLWKSCLKR